MSEVVRSSSSVHARDLDRESAQWLAFADGTVDSKGNRCASSRTLLLDAARSQAAYGHVARALGAYETLLDWELAPRAWVPSVVHEMSTLFAEVGRPEEGFSYSRAVLERLPHVSDPERRRAALDAAYLGALADEPSMVNDVVKLVVERFSESEWAPAVVVLAEILIDPPEKESLLDDATMTWIDERAAPDVRAAAHARLSLAAPEPMRSEHEGQLAVAAWTKATTGPHRTAAALPAALRETVARAALSLADRHGERVEQVLGHGPANEPASFRGFDAVETHLAAIQESGRKLADDYAWLLDARIGLSSEKGILAASRIGQLFERVVKTLERWPAAATWKASNKDGERYKKLRTDAISDFRARAQAAYSDCTALARTAGFLMDGAVACEAGLARTSASKTPALEEIIPEATRARGRDGPSSDGQPVPLERRGTP